MAIHMCNFSHAEITSNVVLFDQFIICYVHSAC